ncbi:MAG: sulfatase-like hydrolase/transferase [Planctomycetota bacterium]
MLLQIIRWSIVSLMLSASPVLAAPPNILIIYTDDVGYSDVSCYGDGHLQTPRIDALAESGRRFTRSHAASATCTPSRFSIITGRYPFRNDRAEILEGDAPLLIEPGSLTVASHLAAAGYHTAVIGKWHLGLGEGEVDWNSDVKPGPLEIGFDRSYLLPATGDRVPCVYLDGHRVENLDQNDPLRVSYDGKIGDWPTGTERPDLLRYPADRQHSGTIVNGVSRIGWQYGGAAALWTDETMVDRFTGRAIEYIESRAATNTPWFLFFNLHQIHVPRLPGEQFIGRSGLGLRGDAMLEVDWSVGRLIDALERLGIREDTLVLFSSDNGPVMNDGYGDGVLRDKGQHDPNGPYRGGKYTMWEAGTRVPFIASWPGTIEPGVSNALMGQIDLLATLGMIAEAPLDELSLAQIDSRDHSLTLLGDNDDGRTTLVTQGVQGLSIHHKNWKYIAANPARRGFANHWSTLKHNQVGNPLWSEPIGPGAYLFDLLSDPGETENLLNAEPEVAAMLENLLERIAEDPRAGDGS